MTSLPLHSLLDDKIVTGLDDFATLPDWLVACMLPDRVAAALRRHIPELADGRMTLLSCTPQRLRAKGDEWLARYSLLVARPSGEPPCDVVLVGNLWPPTDEAAGQHHRDPNLPEAAGSGAPFGEPGWSGWLPDLGLELRVQVADEALPSLPSLVEPAAAAALLERVLRKSGYKDAVIADCTPKVVRYKPGSRCTVVTSVRYAGEIEGRALPDPIVVKTHQGDKGRTAWEAMRALWDSSLAGDKAVVGLAEPLGYLPDERILVQGPLPGEQTLKELARVAISDGTPAAMRGLRDELAKTASALAALHGCGARYGRVATYDEELDEVREVVARLAVSVPRLQAAAQPLLTRLWDQSRRMPSDPVVSAHHDFRPAQVLLDSGAVGFIDFDGACMAEPALDLGRFRAKLRDIGISALAATGQRLEGDPLAENLALMDDLCEGFLAAYQDHSPVSRNRVLLWETADLFTAMLHAWTKVRLARIGPRLAVLLYQVRTAHFEPVGLRPAEAANQP